MSVHTEWTAVTEDIAPEVSPKWWTLIERQYNEPGRPAHDFNFLTRKIQQLDAFRSNLRDARSFLLALFFQYFHYDTKDSDFYLKNIASFSEFADEAGLPEDDVVRSAVKDLLEEASVYSTEEHRTEGAFGDKDIHYLLDLDMLCLGSDSDAYHQYSRSVAEEYSGLGAAFYKGLRQKVLRSLLLIPNIYATKYFREKFEEQARKNIESELAELASS